MDHIDEPEEDSSSSDDEYDESDEDSATSTDVDAKLAEDDVFDIEFFKCYSALKKKDDKIYDQKVRFFSKEESSNSEEESNETRDEQQKKTLLKANMKSTGPKMTLLDHQLSLKDDEIEEPAKIDLNKPVSKSFYEKELDEIKKSIEKISENVDSESDDDLLTVKKSDGSNSKLKPKTKINEMLDKLERDDDQDINHLKQLWSNPDRLTEEERYLRDYILNKKYLPDRNTNSNDEDDGQRGFFSRNLDELSDVEDEEKEAVVKTLRKSEHHSDEKDFDKITRIPRNSTKTIRDLAEKREKKEKRMKKSEKVKKKKKVVKDADFEDIVGDLATKFHYRETEPNDYGLSAEELLMATDEELDKWVSLKETISYKTREEELADKNRYDKKRNDLELKRKIFMSVYSGDDDKAEVAKSKKQDKTEAKDGNSEGVEKAQKPGPAKQSSKRSKKRKRGVNHKKFVKTGVAPDRLLAYGISKTKLKKSKLL